MKMKCAVCGVESNDEGIYIGDETCGQGTWNKHQWVDVPARLDVSGRVNALVCRYLECDPADLLTGVDLADLGADDLDVCALLDQLEHEFDIDLDLGGVETERLTLDELHEACEREVNRQHGA